MHPSAPKRPAFLNRRELFCQHYAAGAGGAEAVRRSGYSPNGAKQRACALLTQPEIRLRIEALRAERRNAHERHLADAVEIVNSVITDAAQQSKCSVTLRAVEFKLKLLGVIRDKRIDLHSYNVMPSPDADLENADCNLDEEFDGLPGYEYVLVPPNFTLPSQAPETQPVQAAAPAEVAPAKAAIEETVTNGDPNAHSVADPTAAPVVTPRPAPHTPLATRNRRTSVAHATEMMTFDDRARVSADDLIAGLAAMTPAFPPANRPC